MATKPKNHDKRFEKAQQLIEEAQGIIDELTEEAQEFFDDHSDGWQEGDKGQEWQEYISALEEKSSGCDNARDGLEVPA